MLNWGIVGTGFISHAMLKAIDLSAGSTALAVQGRNREALQDLQRQYGIAKTFEDFDALLADPEIDILYVALPNHLHHEVSAQALRAGKAVLCEKSLTLTMAQASHLAAAVDESGKFFAEGLMYLSHPFAAKLCEVLQRPGIGELRSVMGHYAADIWQVVNPAGGGTLFNLGCYPASLLQLVLQVMCGEESFGARQLSGLGNIGRDGTLCDAAVTVRFDNGVLANLQSTDSFGMAHGFRVLTSTGVLEINSNPWLPQPGTSHLTWQSYEGEAEIIEIDDDHDAFYHQVKMAEANMTAGNQQPQRPAPRLKDSLELMQFLIDWEAAATSG